MFGLYLFAAILGVGLILFSILGGDGEVDADGPELDPDADAGGGGAAELVLGFFRPRNLTFLLGTFGATGTLLSLVGANPVLTAVLSVAMGLTAMGLTHVTFAWLKRTDSATGVMSDTDLEGSMARVVLPLAPGERGRIACTAGGRELYLTARLAPEVTRPLAPGSEVIIVRTEAGVAEVVPAGELGLPPAIG